MRSTDDLSKRWNWINGSHVQRSHVEVGQKVSLRKKKDLNLSNYQGPDHSIYQAPVLYQMQSGLQAIAYLNLQHLPQPQSQFPTAYWPCHWHHSDAFVLSWYASWFQTCTCRGLYIWSSQVQAYILVRPGGYWSTTKAFVILVILTFLKTKLTFAQGRSP